MRHGRRSRKTIFPSVFALLLFVVPSALSGGLEMNNGAGSGPDDGATVATRPRASTHQWPSVRYDTSNTGRSPYDTSGNTGQLRWRQGGYMACSPVIDSNGTLYLGAGDSYFYAFRPNGSLKWRMMVGTSYFGCAIGPDGTIYTGCTFSGSNFLVAFRSDGIVKWRYPVNTTIATPVTLGPDGTVYFGQDDGNFTALGPEGALKWKYRAGWLLKTAAAIGADGTLLFGSCDSHLYAVSPNGSFKWSFPTDGPVVASPSIAQDGTIYLYSDQGTLYALTAGGSEKWKFECPPAQSSTALGSDGTLYLGSGYSLLAVRPDGTKKWDYRTNGSTDCDPAIGSDGTIYIGSDDKSIHAIKPNGTLRWKYETGREIARSPAIGSDGTVYVCSDDGYLYSIGISPWTPSPPLGLRAIAGDGVVNLSWEVPADYGNANLTGYRIFRGTGHGSETFLARADPSSRMLSDTTVTNGVTYYYYITVTNPVGESGPSNEVNARPRGRPSPPLNLRAAPGFGFVELGWDSPALDGGSPLTGYRVYRGNASGAEIFLSLSAATAYHDLAVIGGLTYFYYVTAYTYAGESGPSFEVSAVPLVPGGNDTTWPTINITVPSDGAMMTALTVTVRGTAHDNVAILMVQIGRDGINWQPVTGTIAWFANITLSSGLNKVYARVMDNSGNTASASINVTVDVDRPSVTILNPQDRSYLSSIAVLASGTAGDTGSGVRNVEVSLDMTNWLSASGILSWLANLSLVSGPNVVYARATDNAGNTNATSVNVTVDPEMPLVSIIYPAGKAVLPTTGVRVLGEASDNVGIRKLELSRDGNVWVTASGTDSWACNMTLAKGANTVYARATDLAGNTATATVSVTVAGQSTTTGPWWDFPCWALLVLLVILLTSLVWDILRKKSEDGQGTVRGKEKARSRGRHGY